MNSIDHFINTLQKISGKSLADLGIYSGLNYSKLTKLNDYFPEEVCDQLIPLLSRINGQEKEVFNFLPDAITLHSMDEIIEEYKAHQEIYARPEEDEEFYDEYVDEDRVRSIIFHSSRIPIAWEDGQGFMFIDLDPGPKGKVGQIVVNFDECDFTVLADNVEHLFLQLHKRIESKQLVFAKADENYYHKYQLESLDKSPKLEDIDYYWKMLYE